MEFKKFKDKYIVRLDKNEEIVDTLKDFVKSKKLR